MIDWIKIRFLCNHKHEISGDKIITIDQDGEVKWELKKSLGVVGSHDSRVFIKSIQTPLTPRIGVDFGNRTHTIEVEGNFVKFFQGHNIDGSENLKGLIYHMIDHLVAQPELGLQPTVWDRNSWINGFIKMHRVDVTRSWDLGTQEAVDSWLKGTQVNAQVQYKGRSVYEEGTVYFGKRSKYWSMKFYNKARELKAKGHRLPEAFSQLPDQIPGVLRGELVFRKRKLEALELEWLSNWKPETADNLYKEYLGKMSLGTRVRVTDKELTDMPRGLRSAYLHWKEGHDVTSLYSKRQLYRIKKGLLEYGIDVTAPQPKKAEVIPMVKYVEATQWEAPAEWHEKGLIFHPNKV